VRPAVEFEFADDELHLLYSPRDDDEWVRQKFERDEPLTIKGTFRFTKDQLVDPDGLGDSKKDLFDGSLRFRLAIAHGDYFKFDPDVVQVDRPVLLHKDTKPTWKWFSSERAVSILGVIARLRPKRIVIGGPARDAIPIGAYEKLVAQFPTPFELKRYTLARVSSVVRDYVETPVDAEKLFQKYIEKRVSRKASDFRSQFLQQDAHKYKVLLKRLKQMLDREETYPESAWQNEILQMVLLLNPRYIHAMEKVRILGEDGGSRYLDILLVDSSGNVDVIEIKKPFGKSIVTQSVYRDNHIPLRELSGSVMQVEKYIFRLNRWGHAGEKALTQRYASKLPAGFQIRITNPSGIIITGRDSNLTVAQRRDFEFIRRKYKSIVDIITYDDLIRRLEYVVSQLTPRPSRGRKGK
jgi:hypothetical protein